MNAKIITRSTYNEKIYEQNELDYPENYQALFDELGSDEVLIFDDSLDEIKFISAIRLENGKVIGVNHQNRLEDEIMHLVDEICPFMG